MVYKECVWDSDDGKTLVHNKKAIEAAMFLMFITYTACAIVAEVKRGTAVAIPLKRYVNDVAYSQIFFFICAMLVQTVVPRVFPIILLYIYMFINIFHPLIYKSQKLVALMIIQILQAIIIFILFIFIMADDWCYFFLYRGST